jgi:N-acylneuraminate cytidylyltransferase
MKFLAIIPARKNSKRLKFKNKKKLLGKPLIEYTINVAKKINFFNNIIITTDDPDILKIAINKNILAPWLRPKVLSTSKASTYQVVKHALEWFEKNFYKVDAIFLLQPTSPFRTKKNILKTLSLFKLNKFKKSIVSMSVEKSTTQRKKNGKNLVPNGSTYLISKKALLKYKSFINKDNVPYLIKSHEETIDIDYPLDWIKAEKVIKKLKNEK